MFDVYLHDVRVGILTRYGNGIRFTYQPDALVNDLIPAISVALPKQPEPFPNSRAGPFFQNLLPEQAYRRLVAAAVGMAPENNLALLGAIGGECPGAVSIWPTGGGPSDTPSYRELSPEELRGLFTGGGAASLGDAVARGRLSLPGVQEKIALLRQDSGSWRLPLHGSITSHILKQATPAFPDLLENELFCMALADASGLEVATTDLAAPDIRVFCSERFDRIRLDSHDDTLRKLHQEDFCQILRTEPDRKYEFDGGPGLRQCADVIRQHSSLPAGDLERLVRWVGFNYLIGNEDAHGKNLALLYRDDGLRLTPHYDLVSTEVYPNLQRTLAMKIGGAGDIRNVQARDWERFATATGLPWTQVREWLFDHKDVVSNRVSETAEACLGKYGGTEIYGAIEAVVERRSAQLDRELSRR